MQSHSEGEKHSKIMSPNRRKKDVGKVGGWEELIEREGES